MKQLHPYMKNIGKHNETTASTHEKNIGKHKFYFVAKTACEIDLAF
jgi:hypothetical protein